MPLQTWRSFKRKIVLVLYEFHRFKTSSVPRSSDLPFAKEAVVGIVATFLWTRM
ncbi:hypothetical protein Lalb_Chr10g0099651 [Lupinus albus]|uniref:Uncharacterized protein n=1 Tax=Lupinus albus TaxID=3870 RepID=A0A6A4PVA5_LUPAL|nr:hypothetical protein Lalb_Chr10g0099651 [Lupinus albus]